MSYFGDIDVQYKDSANIDAFGRLRVSNNTTIFDSKQLDDNLPLFWDDQEVSGTGTSSTYLSAQALSELSVDSLSAGKRVRQTYERFNYQAGKSFSAFSTFANLSSTSGITKRIGYFDDNNGIFLQHKDGVASFVVRSYTSGLSATDTTVEQSEWNVDKFDGTGTSGIDIDWSKAHIFHFDMEWLGVGRVRTGFVVDGTLRYAHHFNFANTIDKPYMSSPNLPLRVEIENDGTGDSSTFKHICNSVNIEGGTVNVGVSRSVTTAGNQLDADTENVLYALMGIRLNPSKFSRTIKLIKLSGLSETNDNYCWELRLNPTINGTFDYSDIVNSPVQYALGTTSNTVSADGYLLDSGVAHDDESITIATSPLRDLGISIDGTPDELIFCVRPLGPGLDIQGAMTWLEIS